MRPSESLILGADDCDERSANLVISLQFKSDLGSKSATIYLQARFGRGVDGKRREGAIG